MALLMLHYLLYPLEISILAQIVHFVRLCIAHMTNFVINDKLVILILFPKLQASFI